jgi:tetratricopeptide (TPR) repeat protein
VEVMMAAFASRVLGVSLLLVCGAFAETAIAPSVLAQTLPIEQQLNIRRHEAERHRDRQAAEQWLEVADRELARGRVDEAIVAWQAALDLYSTLSDQAAMQRLMELLTKTLLIENRFADAERVIQQQLTLARAEDNRVMEMNALNNLGMVYLQNGQLERGTAAINAALEIAETQPDPAARGLTYSNLALAARLGGDLERARDYYWLAILYREQSGDRIGLANSHNSLGAIYRELDNETLALSTYLTAREAALAENHLPTLLTALDGLIGIYADREEMETLETYIAERVATTPPLAPPEQQLGLYVGLGRYYALRQAYPQAQAAYDEALILAETIGAATKRAFVLNQLQDLALLTQED